MNEPCVIRPVRLADAEALVGIYRPFVAETAVSFETEPPTVAEFSTRIERTTADYPWLVATLNEAPIGYAYGCSHRARAAYRFSVETSVYVDPNHHRRGVAGKLYQGLFEELIERGFCNAYAGVTLPNEASVGFHRRSGFVPIGVFPAVGFKFNRWHDVAWFYRPLSDNLF